MSLISIYSFYIDVSFCSISLTSPATLIIALGLMKPTPVPKFIEVINVDGDTAETLLKSDEATDVVSQIFYKGLRESMNT